MSEVILSALFLLPISIAHALKTDRNQPIKIEADHVEIFEKTETSHYRGNVLMVQGSLKITADDVTVYLKDGVLHQVTILGNPAYFEQIPDGKKDMVKSRAKHMEYYAREQRLLLKQDAEVVQGPNQFRGDQIEYDTLTSTVRANKDENSDSRVHAIIQPAEAEKAPPAEPPAPTKP
jgi:lipopolysaccharide export system protein LptA